MNNQLGLIKNNVTKTLSAANQKINCFIGSILGNTLRAYWFNKVINFGDLLNPILFNFYGLTPIITPIGQSNAVALGSLLQDLPENYNGYIVGSGLISDISRKFPYAKILALRGELTRSRIGAAQNTPLGDPGLLAPRLINGSYHKKFILGIIPHYVDKNDYRIMSVLQRYQNDVIIIDVQKNPKNVIKLISQCSNIISSSLHGLITADSLGIPNSWIILSDKIIGNGFKYLDYASAINRKIYPIQFDGREKLSEIINQTQTVSARVPEVQNTLNNVYLRFSNEIRRINSKK